jgi:Cdc6-like AAA superfamily ATPase
MTHQASTEQVLEKSSGLSPLAVPVEKLSRPCNPETLAFTTTEELPNLNDVIGQPRALRALELGIEVTGMGYNIFVLGTPGSGRTTLTRDYLRRKAALGPVPDDWCYVINFENPNQPHALRLPPGRAMEFQKRNAFDDRRMQTKYPPRLLQ